MFLAKQQLGAELPPLVPGAQKSLSLCFPSVDPSGFVFDVQSNTVLAQGGAFENMKEKVNVC